MKPALRIALLATTYSLLELLVIRGERAGRQYTVKTGYLTCHEASGWGFIFGSSRQINCSYSSNGGQSRTLQWKHLKVRR